MKLSRIHQELHVHIQKDFRRKRLQLEENVHQRFVQPKDLLEEILKQLNFMTFWFMNFREFTEHFGTYFLNQYLPPESPLHLFQRENNKLISNQREFKSPKNLHCIIDLVIANGANCRVNNESWEANSTGKICDDVFDGETQHVAAVLGVVAVSTEA
jgi:hypothetical protein